MTRMYACKEWGLGGIYAGSRPGVGGYNLPHSDHCSQKPSNRKRRRKEAERRQEQSAREETARAQQVAQARRARIAMALGRPVRELEPGHWLLLACLALITVVATVAAIWLLVQTAGGVPFALLLVCAMFFYPKLGRSAIAVAAASHERVLIDEVRRRTGDPLWTP